MAGTPHSDINAAALRKLILNCVADDDAGVLTITNGDISGAGDVEMITAGDEGANLPPHAAVDLDDQVDGAAGLVLGEGDAVVRSHRDGVAVDEGRPDVVILVALVDGGDDGVIGDLLVVVGGVDVHPVVVDADAGIGVAGVDGDLDGGGDDVGGGDVEVEDGGVLEGEAGLLGLEDGPHHEDDEEEHEGEGQQPRAAPPCVLAPGAVVVVAHFLRHGGSGGGGGGGGVWGGG